MSFRTVHALLGSSALLALSTPALAQSAEQTTADAANQPPAPEATAAANDERADTATSEIIVTARYQEERLQETPIAISAINAEEMEMRAFTTAYEVAYAVPNASLT